MWEGGSQQTGCLLFTVVQIESVRPAFEARGPGGLFTAALSSLPSPRPPRAHKHAWHQPLPPRTVVSFLHQSWSVASMGTSVWANEQHLFLSSTAAHANHNTNFIWPLSWSQAQHVIDRHPDHKRYKQKEILIFITGKCTLQNLIFFHNMCVTVVACCSVASPEKKVFCSKATFQWLERS